MTKHSIDPANDLPTGFLESQWPLIQQAGSRIADEIDIKSDGLSGSFRKQTLATSHFFRGEARYEKALYQPCVLAIANPLARLANGNGNEISQSHIATASHLGFCTLSRHGSNQRSLFRIFLYPIMLILFGILGAVFISFFIMPTFEQMYAEFGIALPGMSRMYFYLGYLVRTYVVSIMMVVFGLPLLVSLMNWIGHEKRDPGLSRIDVLLSRKRPTVSRWLLHTSLLIEAGLANEDALQMASATSGKRWVSRLAAIRKHRLESKQPIQDNLFFNRDKLRMADMAFAMPRSRGQVTLLQQVATWYRDTSSGIIEWFAQLLTPLLLGFILITTFLLIISLFFPMFAITSGLTGGGAPGGFF
jgi:hypothetical protein